MQMRSHRPATVVISLVAACSGGSSSSLTTLNSTSNDAPDLSLKGVAFARLSEGRVVSRGTAKSVDYRREGGRLVATSGSATILPDSGTELASFGALHVQAPSVDGEVANRRGTAQGGVHLETGRGDQAFSESIAYDGTLIRSETPVTAHGPGYRVQGQGMVAKADGTAVQLTRGVSGQMRMEAGR
jgi:hypothetical protein